MIYFVSDFHLSYCDSEDYKSQEQRICNWLESIEGKAKSLFLLGDVFDYWFEYSEVVPKGYIKLLGQLQRLVEKGTNVYYFKGNHDLWAKDYFETYLGFNIYNESEIFVLDGKKFFLSHGDGLGNGEGRYKFYKSIMKNSFCQRLYSMLHPDIGLKLMRYFSNKSRAAHFSNDIELAVQRHIDFVEDKLVQEPIDFFIMGHLHSVEDIVLSNGYSRYINLGYWKEGGRIASWNGKLLQTETWTQI